MSINANGATVSAVYANGAQIQNVYANGTLVWSASPPAGTWQNCWSGVAYISDFPTNFNASTTGEIEMFSYRYTFAGMNPAPKNGAYLATIQLDAEYYVENFDHYMEYISNELMDTLSAERNNYNEVTNLPWNSYGTLGSHVTLDTLVSNGSVYYLDATYGAAFAWGEIERPYIVVKNVYYYKKG